MREAWDRGDGSTERTGGEGDEDIEKVFQIRQQAISHGLEETEEMKSLLHEVPFCFSFAEFLVIVSAGGSAAEQERAEQKGSDGQRADEAKVRAGK
eukprot:759756-Hanusia_phi.AAC.2